MKIPLTILGFTALALALIWAVSPGPTDEQLAPRTDLPWQIEVLPNGNVRVFDLELGAITLADAKHKFGTLEGTAVFQAKDGTTYLEAYFGEVRFGPLKAKVVTTLEADRATLDRLIAKAPKREGSPTGDWKFKLPAETGNELLPLAVNAISYQPGTRGLDADFFRQRFGEPAYWLQEGEQAVSWFYPERGLSILIDSEAKEILEYTVPRNFVVPEGAMANDR